MSFTSNKRAMTNKLYSTDSVSTSGLKDRKKEKERKVSETKGKLGPEQPIRGWKRALDTEGDGTVS